MENKRFREARRSATAMLEILPDLPEAKQLVQEINRRHPMIRVGVMQRSTELDPSSLSLKLASRAPGNLTNQSIFSVSQNRQ